jgi:hypothetical protein
MYHRKMRFALAAYAAALIVLASIALAGAAWLVHDTAPGAGPAAAAAPHTHNVLSWELRHLPEKWLYKLGGLVTDQQDGKDDDRVIQEYIWLLAEIAKLEREQPGSTELADAEARRAYFENSIEDIVEGRVTSVLESEGLTIGPPPFTDLGAIFPPVDFEIDASPRLLVISPRDRIERTESFLLQPGIGRDTAVKIEEQAEEKDGTSALVVRTGGVAMYPSVVSAEKDYRGLVETAFHEWLHQHLILFPIGRGYFSGPESRTLNESVADIAGRELARLYFERYGNPTKEPVHAGATSDFDFAAEMRALHAEVKRLLEDGQTEEAEALMNRKRDEFETQGVYVRRINQAYFAFYGSYADSPAAIDPIGPKLESLLALAESPGDFVRDVYGVTSRDELDAAVRTAGD